jgi:hypothetical protein
LYKGQRPCQVGPVAGMAHFAGWRGNLICMSNTFMESLKTESVRVKMDNGWEEYSVQEKDFGDLVVYDICRQDHYLLTIAGDGSILYMNFDADDRDKEIFTLSHLNFFIEKIKAHA